METAATLTIDGRQIAAHPGETVLQTALRHGISIPHLCTHPNLPAFGACRLCIVEIDGVRGYPASCSTPATEGMVVRTDTSTIQNLRRAVLELILAEHPAACLVCDKRELCEKYRPKPLKAGRTIGCHTCNNKQVCEVRDLSESIGLASIPYVPFYRQLPVERSDPFIDRDLNLCILCGRCVRICEAHHGQSTIAFVGRGSQTRIGEAFGRSLTEAGCRFCGSCIDVCPTGSLSDRYAKWYGAPEQSTATTCMLCDAGCALTVNTSADNRAAMARAIDTHVPICVLGRFAIPEFLNGVARLKVPQVRVGKALRALPWSQALAQAAERLKPFVGDGFALVCDRTCTLEDRYVLRKFTREVMQSPHYLEIEPDERGVSRTSLPEGVRAALLTGDFVDPERLQGLDLLIVQDCYPTPVGERAAISLPVTVLAEVAGTWVDGQQRLRPLQTACGAPGAAKPDWQIICELARAMEAAGFEYASPAAIATEMGANGASLGIGRSQAPPAASDPSRRRTHFRGHCLEEKVRGLRDLRQAVEEALARRDPARRAASVAEAVATAAAIGG
jgi:predicted molibdopterin-dependent oxidoreductase YjgC